MKPPGISLGLDHQGNPTMHVTPLSRATDLVWEMVVEAISEGQTPTQIMREVREAWEYELNENAKITLKEFDSEKV